MYIHLSFPDAVIRPSPLLYKLLQRSHLSLPAQYIQFTDCSSINLLFPFFSEAHNHCHMSQFTQNLCFQDISTSSSHLSLPSFCGEGLGSTPAGCTCSLFSLCSSCGSGYHSHLWNVFVKPYTTTHSSKSFLN